MGEDDKMKSRYSNMKDAYAKELAKLFYK